MHFYIMCRFSIIDGLTKKKPILYYKQGLQCDGKYFDTVGLAVKKLHTSQACINGKVAAG